MFVAKLIASGATPSPTNLNAGTVNPGPSAGILFAFLAVALVALLFSMNRHLKKVNFEEDRSN